jgi:DNA invertase Pin-like site-specific DNA recombinase
MYYIYQRISTEKQSLIRQEGAIGDYCKANNITVPNENIFSDVITGKTIKREHYQEMKSKLVKNDILIILDLDRLGRNWDLIKTEWQELTQRGVYIIVVNCPLINVLPDKDGQVSVDKRLIQEMMFTLLCYVSQKEIEKVSTRTRESLKAKREQGIVLGRPPVHTAEQRADVRRMYGEGKRVSQIAEATGLARSTINRMIEDLR